MRKYDFMLSGKASVHQVMYHRLESTHWRCYRNSFLVVCRQYLHIVQLLGNVNYSLNPQTKRGHVPFVQHQFFILALAESQLRIFRFPFRMFSPLSGLSRRETCIKTLSRRWIAPFTGNQIKRRNHFHVSLSRAVFFFFTCVEELVRAISFVQ